MTQQQILIYSKIKIIKEINNMANIKCTGNLEVQGQSKLSGPVILGQSDTNAVQFGIDGRMNATDKDGVSTRTILGMSGGVLGSTNPTLLIGSDTFATNLRGSSVTYKNWKITQDSSGNLVFTYA